MPSSAKAPSEPGSGRVADDMENSTILAEVKVRVEHGKSFYVTLQFVNIPDAVWKQKGVEIQFSIHI